MTDHQFDFGSYESALPEDHPIRIAFDAFKKSEKYCNALNWSRREPTAEGSLWSAFETGWACCLRAVAAAERKAR